VELVEQQGGTAVPPMWPPGIPAIAPPRVEHHAARATHYPA